ncbi:Trigger factor [Flavobacterium longum]|uniref:trigger factor n=1 Tax=Flavobacterium longum TaxID=1299340 RepID=UPI0039ED8383
MEITKKNIDDLNAVVTLKITKDDYAGNVEKTLDNYRKSANIPGFRKGAVPMSLVKKQYGKAVLLEEVNKLIQEKLNGFLQEEKIDLLGNPLPKADLDIDWDADDFQFEFELGLAPTFDVDLSAKNSITQYKIVADEKMIDDQVRRIRKQFGKLISQNEITEDADVTGVFLNEDKGIENRTTISLDIFKDKKTSKSFIGKKVGDIVSLQTKGLFDDDHKLMDYLKVSHDDVHGLDVTVDFKIEEITTSELAELNQDLFDKLFGPGVISSEKELKAKIKEDAEKQFATSSDQKFLNDVTDFLLKNTKFDLPSAFLKKWIQTAGENPMTPEEAEAEYNKSESGLRYQLIEGKIMTDNNLQLTFDELKAYTSNIIKRQMAQFGQMNPTDQDVEGIVARVLSNQDEAKRLSEQVMSEKMLNLFKEKVKAKTKEVQYEAFVKELYGE